MDQERFESICVLLKDEDFVKEITGCTMEDTIKAFAAHGVTTTEDELHELWNMTQEKEGELSESDMEAVAGGRFNWGAWWGDVKATARGLWDGFFGK